MTLPGTNVTTYANDDVSYHRGSLFDGAVPSHAGAYQIGALQVPAHWWNAVVRVRKNPITIIRKPAQIVAANRMFPFGDTGCKVGAQGARTPFTIMGSSNITKGMTTTGERGDIGLVTNNSGFFMLGGDPLPMLDWAQANDSVPIHFRDETTGKPIDLLKYPSTNCYDPRGRQGEPWLPKGPYSTVPGEQDYTGFGGGWTPDQAHFCEMSYLAYMATGDLGFLENLQYNANFTVLCDAYSSNPTNGAVIHGNLRGIGWALRNLFMAHAATMDAEKAGTLPATCHPSSYWKKLLDQSLTFHTQQSMNDPNNQRFRIIGEEKGRTSPWCVDYVLTALAFGVLTGHSDWTPFYLWALGNAIARTNGTSGYPPGAGTSYRLSFYPLHHVTNEFGTFPTTEPDMSQPQYTWAQAFAALEDDPEVNLTQAEVDMLVTNPLNGGKSYFIGSDEYMMTTRAVLVMADYLDKKGLADVRGTFPDFDASMKNAERMFRSYGLVNPRVSVVSDPDAVPVTLPPPPPPPVEPPPTKPSVTLSTINNQVNRLKTIVGVQ